MNCVKSGNLKPWKLNVGDGRDLARRGDGGLKSGEMSREF